MELSKATLQKISADDPPRTLGDPIPVQFNPTSLRLQLSNRVEGGRSKGRQNRQFLGSSSTQLTLDLVFDTADEGSENQPRSVREKTALVEQFVLPRVEGNKKQAPPKLRFHWGRLVIDGLVDSVNVDFDHFAADGTPLRAKVGLTIKEQDSKYQFLRVGPGANPAGNAPTPGAAAAGAPGSSGSGGDSSAPAIGGESAADFAARMGLDPAAWRSISGGLENPLSLQAGAQIDFSAGVSAGIGLGASFGVQAGASLSLEASLGLTAGVSAGAAAGSVSGRAAGFSLSAAGGVGSALESAKIAKSEAAQQRAKAAFLAPAATGSGDGAASSSNGSVGVTPPGSAATRVHTGLPDQPRPPLARSGMPAPGSVAKPAPSPPRADPRAVSFAFGVPLRATVGPAADQRADVTQGSIRLRAKTENEYPPQTDDPTLPGWVALPDQTLSSGGVSKRRSDGKAYGCGCGGGT